MLHVPQLAAHLGQQQRLPVTRCLLPDLHHRSAKLKPAKSCQITNKQLQPRSTNVFMSRATAPDGGLGDLSHIAVGEPMDNKSYEKYMPDWSGKRRAGVLLHPTSLPGGCGIGELGSECYAFLDWVAAAGLQCWQVLPLVPPDPQFYSPYSGTDSNCGNPLLISIDELIKDGLLDGWDRPVVNWDSRRVEFSKVDALKAPLLRKAAQRLLNLPDSSPLKAGLKDFRAKHPWIEDSALFDVLRNQEGLSELAWWDWPAELRDRQPEAIQEFRAQNTQLLEEFIAIQYMFDKQWMSVKAYANSKGIKIVGDMPIYVGGHSADVWANRHLFELSPTGAPGTVSGVPPDCFAAEGQLWGSPLYKWSEHKKEGFKWWANRLGRSLELNDQTRIDHFRGFAGYWSVDGKEKTAINGQWRKGPGLELFEALKQQLGAVPILAEDLGVITKDVVDLRESIEAPGMVVLQFAWGSDSTNVHLPHQHYENCFVYSGTHDNETTVGWFRGSANAQDKKYIKEYLGSEGQDIAWDFIRACMKSVARTCIVPMQDILRLDNTARMNTPGRAEDNWHWRLGTTFNWGNLHKETEDIRSIVASTNRAAKQE